MEQTAIRNGDGAPQESESVRLRAAGLGGLFAVLVTSLLLVAGYYSGQEPADLAAAPAPTREARAQLARTSFAGAALEDEIAVGDAAEDRNARIEFMGAPMETMPGFTGKVRMGASYDTAQRCLAQAIYYEAALEPESGKRAVAQVVLNRMRHPAYPSTVCGVVYEGWSKRVCQFSFTCDGSLRRAPIADLWKDANRIAGEMLAGSTQKDVGSATHYHADYVLPGWAMKMGKLKQIGRHIFYRFPDGWGRAAAFTQGWRGAERMPDRTALLARVEDIALVEDLVPEEAPAFTPGLTVVPDVTDRHAPTDVGGRIDTTKEWRLSIPDPVKTPGSYRAQPVVAGDPVAEAAQ